MAAPNLLSLTTVTPSSIQSAPVNTNATQLVTNAAASATTCIVYSLFIANTNTTTAYSVTVNYYSAATLGGTAYAIASTVSVPPNATIVIINRDDPVYMLENTSLGFTCSTGSELVANCFWDVVS